MRRASILPLCLVGCVLFVGCTGIDSTANPGIDEPSYTADGLPVVDGIDDGASADLGERVLWLNETARPEHRRNVTVVNLTEGGDPANYREQARVVVARTIRYQVQNDHRIEPYHENGSETAYNVMRRYLADAMRRSTPDGPVDQTVVVEYDDRYYRVTIGDEWTGGPVVDPSDPPHPLSVGRYGPNASVTLRHEGDIVLSRTVDLTDETTRIDTPTRPGNYSVAIVAANGTTYRGNFSLSASLLGDCNQSSTYLRRNGTRLEAESGTNLKGCGDPADRSASR